MKLTARNWICWWGLAGLVVPVVLLLRSYLFDHSFGEVELILWPSSFILMALEGPPERLVIVVVYAIAIAANVLLYSIVGVLGWMLLDPILRRHAEKG
jgi:hypothetical protein